MTRIRIERDQVATVLAMAQSMSGRSVVYSRQRLIAMACQLEDVEFREQLLDEIDAVYGNK